MPIQPRDPAEPEINDVTDWSTEQQQSGQASQQTQNTNVNTNEILEESNEDGSVQYVIEKESGWADIEDTFDDGVSDSQMSSILTNLTGGIFGMPYQFMEEVDPMPDGSEFGEKYLQKIVSVMPVLFISPGEPAFMQGYSDEDRNNVARLYESSNNASINDVIKGKTNGKFYTFVSRFNEYVKYVNVMVRGLSNLMGMGDERYFNGTGRRSKLKAFNLNDMLNENFQSLFNANTSVAFYLDAETSISENFSNSTTESMLSSKVNQMSDLAKEINFLTTSINTGSTYDAITNALGDTANTLADGLGGIPLAGGVLDKLAYGINTIISGGKMVFPEIWSTSEYSRSYNITIKLRSPDYDALSILLNIYIPLCCLICLAGSHQMGVDANGYVSPFLVRATYKSIFNCEMGIITSLDIQKGAEDKWNGLGMPTSVDVTVTIKDLYSTMFLSNSTAGLLNNTSQLDYMALMAGLDMNKDWIARRAKLAIQLGVNGIPGAIPSAWNMFKTGANKTVGKFLNKTVGADTRFNL